MDARTFNEMEADNHLVQNNFGAAIGGPLLRRKDVLLRQLRGTAQSEGDDHGRHGAHRSRSTRRFQRSRRQHLQPVQLAPESEFRSIETCKRGQSADPARSPFPGNVIPSELINPAAAICSTSTFRMPNSDGHGRA